MKVEVTYNNGVSLTGINADSYILEDRGTLSPDYGKVKIAKAVVDGSGCHPDHGQRAPQLPKIMLSSIPEKARRDHA